MGTSTKSRKNELEQKGWIKRTTVDEAKLSEIVNEYERLGFEVRLEPVKLDELNEGCQRCYGSNPDRFKTVYVRKKP